MAQGEHLKGKGFDGKPENRNSKGITGKRGSRSELRKLVNKLKLREDIALDIIDNSLKGLTEDKDQLQSAKWVVERIASITSAAISEESRKMAIKKGLDNTEDNSVGEEDNSIPETPKPRFSLKMLDGGKKNDEDIADS